MSIEGINTGEAITTDTGGKQSKIAYRFDLIDPGAAFKLAGVLYEGSLIYDADNWRKISSTDHINHALCDLYAHLAGVEGTNPAYAGSS